MDTKLPNPSIRLLKQLSRNIYSSFKVGLKEIVTNSFDADATLVKITIDNIRQNIKIDDNGSGMSQEEVYNYFLKAGSTTKDSVRANSRPTIGYKGIGVFSLFFFAKKLIITTKKKDSDPVRCIVDLNKLRTSGNFDESISSFEILKWETNFDKTSTGTVIELEEIEEESFNTIWVRDTEIVNQPIYSYFIEVLPIQYIATDEGLGISSLLKEENEQLKKWNFNIEINTTPLFRTTPYSYFSSNDITENMYIKEFRRWINEKIEIKGIMFGGIEKIKNERVSGFLLRNNNVAIGSRKDNPFGMHSRVHMLQWVSGEILIIGDINEIITTDRERLVEDNEIYYQIKNIVQEEVNPFLSTLRQYSIENKYEKDKKKEETGAEVLENILDQFVKAKTQKTKFKLQNFETEEDAQLVKYDESKDEVLINKSSSSAGKFSKWNDKELFYTFLAILQNTVSNDGNKCCKDLLNKVQEEYDLFLKQSEGLKENQSEFGF